MNSDIRKRVLDVFDIEALCIETMREHFDEDAYDKAVEFIKNADRVATVGCGHSGIMCQDFAHLLCCIDVSARFIYPSEAIHGGMGFLKKGDVIVLASRGGKTKELLPIIDICQKRGVKMIAITANLKSELASKADVVLYQHVNLETDRYNSQGTTSSTSLLIIFHCLQTAIMEAMDYKEETFCMIHPGGAVGETFHI